MSADMHKAAIVIAVVSAFLFLAGMLMWSRAFVRDERAAWLALGGSALTQAALYGLEKAWGAGQ